MLHNIQVALVHLQGQPLARFEGNAAFREISPFVTIPDSTIAGWWTEEHREDDWGLPEVIQQLKAATLVYRKGEPPSVPPPAR